MFTARTSLLVVCSSGRARCASSRSGSALRLARAAREVFEGPKLAALFGALIVTTSMHAQQWVQVGVDIDGDEERASVGNGVALSSDGTRMAVAAGTASIPLLVGHLRVYDLVDGAWTQVGGDVETDAAGEFFKAVALSSNGGRVAIGNPNAGTNGLARVYDLIGGSWTPVGGDIEGSLFFEVVGGSVDLSSDGDRLVVGATRNTLIASSGRARVFELVAGDWVPVGGDIVGVTGDPQFGGAVALSADGNRVAVGDIDSEGATPGAGHVRVFDLVSGAWTQVGADMIGEATNDAFGGSLALSSDGGRIVIGATGNDEAGQEAGHARVFDLVANSWTQVGSDIDGEAAEGLAGSSVAISADGNRIAIGEPEQWNSPSSGGKVRVFDLVQGSWEQVGASLDGEAPGDQSGRGIALSCDGKRVAIGATRNDGFAVDAGHVRVFDGPRSLAYPASEVARLGNPANPNALLPGQTSGPVLGAVWDPVIDHSAFQPTATADFLACSTLPPVNVPLQIGTLLCSVSPTSKVFISAPGVAFSIPVPFDCSFLGMEICTQGAAIAADSIQLTNALDIVIGSF